MRRVSGAILTVTVALLCAAAPAVAQDDPFAGLPRCASPPPLKPSLELYSHRRPDAREIGRGIRQQIGIGWTDESGGRPDREPIGGTRIDLSGPGFLFPDLSSRGVASTLMDAPELVANGPVTLTVTAVAPDGSCYFSRTITPTVVPPCYARLARPGRYARGSRRGPGYDRSLLWLPLDGCGDTAAVTTVVDVRVFAAKPPRRPRPRGASIRFAPFLELAASPISRQELFDRTRVRRRASIGDVPGGARRGFPAEFLWEERDSTHSLGPLVAPRPLLVSTGRNGRTNQNLLAVAYDASGNRIGPKWLLKVRPRAKRRRGDPAAFHLVVTRVR